MERYNSSHRNPLISNLKAYKMVSNGLLSHIVRVNDFDHEIPSIDLMLVVNEFLDVFNDDFPGVPPPRRIDFFIDLEHDTKPIPIAP